MDGTQVLAYRPYAEQPPTPFAFHVPVEEHHGTLRSDTKIGADVVVVSKITVQCLGLPVNRFELLSEGLRASYGPDNVSVTVLERKRSRKGSQIGIRYRHQEGGIIPVRLMGDNMLCIVGPRCERPLNGDQGAVGRVGFEGIGKDAGGSARGRGGPTQMIVHQDVGYPGVTCGFDSRRPRQITSRCNGKPPHCHLGVDYRHLLAILSNLTNTPHSGGVFCVPAAAFRDH